MEKEFIVTFDEEQGNYLQRLGTEVETKTFLIDRLFANHVNDVDTLLFESIPFKHYHSEYEKSFLEYEVAKREFEDNYLRPIVMEKTDLDDPSFTWKIVDFLSNECIITLMD